MTKALDLFCGGGGASVGLKRAGFSEIVGIDLAPQPEYPFEFICADALSTEINLIRSFDFIWASPPCQAYPFTSSHPRLRGKKYPDLIAPTRDLLFEARVSCAIENVPAAPIRKDILLCGEMFGLRTIRHRHFEIHGWGCLQPFHPAHKPLRLHQGYYAAIAGQGGGQTGNATLEQYRQMGFDVDSVLELWQQIMGIDWITNRKMLAEAVPPIYAEYLGRQFLCGM